MSTTQVRTADPSSRPAVAIQATATPVLSYALAHNRVPVVSRLAFTNHGGAVHGATVRLGVRDAEGPIGSPVELLVDLDAGQTTVLSDAGLVMDPAAMLQIEEQRPGSIEIDLLVDGEDVGGTAVPVQVLAANQWLAAPVPLALEMLAAHVLPNHPSVTTLIGEAADLLEERTGSGSVQGYQSGPERVDEIVAALAEAVQRRAVRYTEPPAGWADVGQKVRTPGDVLDGRVGTCLDTVVTLAAALEQAGIRPLLWVAEGVGGGGGTGHAFLGYWREERSAESVATTDVAPLVDLVDLGLIRLVETTLLTSRGTAGADLHAPAYSAWLAGAGDLDRVLGVTDVHRARRDGIVPLPARTRGRDGAVQVVEYRPAVHSVVSEGGYLPRLRNLAYKAKTVREETGANNLYLALGSLVWELDGRPLRSPLVLVPVTLTPTSRNGVYRLALDDTGSSTPNYCLLEKLRQVHGLAARGLTEPGGDGGGFDLAGSRQAMRQALADAGLPPRVEATADLAVL